jgi:glyceraldehyde-3-phosphate dehydrogenase (NADP+)
MTPSAARMTMLGTTGMMETISPLAGSGGVVSVVARGQGEGIVAAPFGEAVRAGMSASADALKRAPAAALAGPSALELPWYKMSPFYDPALDALWPAPDDPHLAALKSDAGLTVSFRGAPETWGGSKADVNAVVRVKRADGQIVPFKIGEIAQVGRDEALSALRSALRAYDGGFGAWPSMDVRERCDVLEPVLSELTGAREAIVQLLMGEIGKNRGDAEKEFDRTMDYMRATLAEARAMADADDRVHEDREVGKLSRRLRIPLGTALVMGPSNYPWNEGFGTSAFPALVMGNSLVYKPPRTGQLLLQAVVGIFAKHLPPGVLNLVSGDGREVVGPILETGEVKLLYFIGSTGVAQNHILPKHGNLTELRSVLGLGSKNALVVRKGADLNQAAKFAVQGAFGNRGERCTGTSLVIADRSVAAELAERIARIVETRTVGMPWENADDTPFPDTGKAQAMEALVIDAAARGARIVNAGGGTHNGYIYRPAVLYPVGFDADVARKEVFGPVLAVISADRDEDIENHLRALPFHQQLGIVAKDGDLEALAFAARFGNQFTEVNVNGIPKRDDAVPDKRFGALHEIPLGLRPALEAASVLGYLSVPATQAYRETLTSMSYADLRRLVRGSERIERKDGAGDTLPDGSDGEPQ